MPTEERVGFEDEERLFPILDAAGKEDELETISLRNGRLFDLAVKDNQLLAKQSVFSDQVGFTACKSAAVLNTIEWREG